MKEKLKIHIFKYNNSSIDKKELKQQEIINIKDNKYNKLSRENIDDLDENYFIGKQKITLKEKFSLFVYIFIGIIVLLHSFHFILSEYVRKIY